jgi:DNA polymerase III epsilon subunit-like protein
MDNITFDLETLGNSSYAPIVQIGAVKFTSDGNIIDQFCKHIKLTSLKRYESLVLDYETLAWWFSQDDKAIKSVFCNPDAVDLRLALLEFSKWIGKASEYVYWSHATFDPPILDNNAQSVGLNKIIPHRNHRDIRTLIHFVGEIEVERLGIHHNALDDALYQATYISKGLIMLKQTSLLEK